MAAVLLKSEPDVSGLPDQTSAVGAAPVAAASALLEDLRLATTTAAQRLLDTLFGAADEVLYVLGERAADADERRQYLDAMRLLPLERGAITRRFQQELLTQFKAHAAPGAAAVDDDDSHAEQIDEQVTLINLASRIKHLHAAPATDLQQRLTRITGNGATLSPRDICNAFSQSLRQLGIVRPSRLVLYRLFDRLVVPALSEFYEDLLRVLAQYAVGAVPVMAPPRVAETRLPPLSVATMQCLQRKAETAEPTQTPEALLARELLAIVRGKVVAGGPAVLQRLCLAGYAVDAACTQAASPVEQQHAESLRYAALRCALADAAFLADATHALRVALLDDTLLPPAGISLSATAMLAGLRVMESLPPAQIVEALRALSPQAHAA